MKVCRVLVVSVVLSVLSLWLYLADAQQSRPEVLPPGISRTPVLEASRVPSPAQQKSLKEQLVEQGFISQARIKFAMAGSQTDTSIYHSHDRKESE